MVTAKFKSIIKILKADNVMLFTKRQSDNVDALGFGKGDLKTIMLMAVELKKSYNNMVDMASSIATETGELHALNELKATLEAVENGRQ